jgi:outer membrane protein OmpA-like peptidoglycan-associated protein
MGSAAVAALAIASLPLASLGCGDNRLPPVPVPKPDYQRPLPAWYPEAPWSAKEGKSQIFIEGKIVFDTDKATIRPGSEKVLSTLLQFLKEHAEVTRLRVSGHTDSMASDEHNQELSAQRALTVCHWLVDHGIDHMRLMAVGFGESKPIAPNEVAEGRSENRRTEFHVAEVNGRPFGGGDGTNGGMVLDVLSTEQRRLEQERLAKPKTVAPVIKTFKATGDELKELKPNTPQAPVVKKPGEG